MGGIMGLFSKLFVQTDIKPTAKETPRAKQYALPENVNFILGDGSYSFDIVGEASFQYNLRKICGPRKEEGEDRQEVALLIFEDANPNDDYQAVCVKIKGMTVGYMDKESAISFRERVKEANIPVNRADLACYAVIRGGWDRDGEKGQYRVWLDIFDVED
jgi:hypothetical protein